MRENLIMALQAKRGMFHLLSRKQQEEFTDKYIDMLQIKTASREDAVKSLSGGSRKVIIGRWLLTNPDFLILDRPTRGIDVGTKTEIQKLVRPVQHHVNHCRRTVAMKNMTFKKITSQRLFLPIFCLALVLLVNIVTTPNFFAIEVRNGVLYGYLIDIINRASELVILAVGMTLVVSSSAGTDISVGAIMAVSAAVCCNILTGGERAATAYANPLILGFLAALIVGAAIGCFNGFLVAKLNIQPMVATLIMFTAGRGIAQLITDGQITYVRVDSYRTLGASLPGFPVPTPFIVAVVVVALTSLLLKKTALGMYIQSVGINKRASQLVGASSRL